MNFSDMKFYTCIHSEAASWGRLSVCIRTGLRLLGASGQTKLWWPQILLILWKRSSWVQKQVNPRNAGSGFGIKICGGPFLRGHLGNCPLCPLVNPALVRILHWRPFYMRCTEINARSRDFASTIGYNPWNCFITIIIIFLTFVILISIVIVYFHHEYNCHYSHHQRS